MNDIVASIQLDGVLEHYDGGIDVEALVIHDEDLLLQVLEWWSPTLQLIDFVYNLSSVASKNVV